MDGLGPAVRARLPVLERGQARADLALALEVELGHERRLPLLAGLREHRPPGVDDHRAPAGVLPARVLAGLVGRDHERLVLDRPRPHQRLPVVARRRQRERGRDRDDPRTADREDPVQLREAQVVADGEAQLDALGGLREHDLLAGLLELGLAVDAPADLDVEHVHLAVDGPDLSGGVDVDARVGELLLPGHELEDRAGDDLDAQLARARARPADRGSVERLRRGALVILGAHRRPLLGEYDQPQRRPQPLPGSAGRRWRGWPLDRRWS